MPDASLSAALALATTLALMTALALLLQPARALAQVSPGPLARAHESLDQPTLCFKCHGRSGEMTARCLACHTAIAAQVGRGGGYHGRETKGKDCAGCHPDHAGREFALVRWDEGRQEAFDHRRAGLALTGKHATAACADCHQAKFQRAPAVAAGAAREPAHRWLGLDPACTSCHQDPHRGRFGATCTKCHGTTDWKRVEANRFDHDLTRYPLRGKHAAVRCESCHDPASPTAKDPPFATCGSCHKDAHAGQALLAGKPADCAACHDVAGFRPATFTVAMHQNTTYPLEGRHAAVACAACHPKKPGEASLGSAGTLLRPPHARCASCHADTHGGQLAARADRGACESCHRVSGWRPATITVADHAALRFRLEGAHARAECGDCHGAERKGLAPFRDVAALGSAKFAFRTGELDCVSCHHDPHQGRYAAGGARPQADGCLGCHDLERWRPSRVTVAAHQKYSYPLDGAHRAVPCTGCHTELAGRPARPSLVAAEHPAPLPFAGNRRDCVTCHTDPHGGQFADRRDHGACEGCHGAESWRPADRFVHDRDTRFKLEGAHAKVACAACHPARRNGAGAARVVYHGVPVACESCHGSTGRASGGAR